MSGHVNKSRAVTLSLLTVCDSRPTLFLKKKEHLGVFISLKTVIFCIFLYLQFLCVVLGCFLAVFEGGGGQELVLQLLYTA